MSGFVPIAQKFLLPNQRMALGFRRGDGIGWVFIRVVGVEPTNHRPFTNQLTPIAAAGTLDQVELKDTSGSTGTPLFGLPESLAGVMIYHAGIGLNPPKWIRVYPRYGTGDRRGEIENFNPISLGSDYGYVTGDDTPYAAPTDALEGIFPFSVRADYGFANKDPDDLHQPVFNVVMRKYRIEVLSPDNPEHAPLIQRMATGAAPVYWWVMGTVGNPMDYRLKPYWAVDPFTIDEATRAGARPVVPRPGNALAQLIPGGGA